jgi:uroporphyrinogen decarboxylase
VFFNGPTADIAITGQGGIAVFPLLCMTEPEFVADLHETIIQHNIRQIERLLPALHGYIDVYISGCDDWGSQEQLFAPPNVFRELFAPYYRRFNDAVHGLAPGVKTYIHACGAVFDLMDDIIGSGFDILNPVQWPAGRHSYREWKDACRNRIVLWGGGVNAQRTLAFGSVDDVRREVREITRYMKKDGGFVFNNIHNILAEVPPEKIMAMYETAAGCA